MMDPWQSYPATMTTQSQFSVGPTPKELELENICRDLQKQVLMIRLFFFRANLVSLLKFFFLIFPLLVPLSWHVKDSQATCMLFQWHILTLQGSARSQPQKLQYSTRLS